jgi:hypothetical protein
MNNEFVFRNSTEAIYALSNRKKITKTKEERERLIQEAARFVPALSKEIYNRDKKLGLI